VTTDRTLLDITPLAEQKLREGLDGHREEGSVLRVMVSVGTEGGVRYSLGIEEESRESDLVIEAGDLKLVVDPTDGPLIDGVQIDYVDGLMRSGFVISNPNLPAGERGGCSCGGGGCGCGGGGCGCGGH
jgi:iron-sulfur cluster assembly accessory protein